MEEIQKILFNNLAELYLAQKNEKVKDYVFKQFLNQERKNQYHVQEYIRFFKKIGELEYFL